MVFMACCRASIARSPAYRVATRPAASRMPCPSRLRRAMSSPTTGNWATAESTIRSRSSGWSASTMPSVVTSTSSSGKMLKNAKYATRAAKWFPRSS
jgi:hypothetical protein